MDVMITSMDWCKEMSQGINNKPKAEEKAKVKAIVPRLLEVKWGLLDPEIEFKNLKNEIDKLESEINTEVNNKPIKKRMK